MIKLAPFYPAIVVLIGAIFVAAGGFWASYRQSNFNMEIRAKNEEIAALQKDNADAITGGDSFAEAAFSMLDRSGNMTNAFSMPDQLLLVPTFIHRGKHPLYDVSVRFSDLQAKFDAQNALRAYPIGNMTPGLATITGGINLPHDGKDLNFNIFFVGRNGMWIQFLRMPWMGDGWGRASKIERNGVVIFEEISKNFPLNEKGAVDWDHPATNRALCPHKQRSPNVNVMSEKVPTIRLVRRITLEAGQLSAASGNRQRAGPFLLVVRRLVVG